MLSETRQLPFWIGFVCLALVVLVESGLSFWFVRNEGPPGMGVPYMGLLDGLFLYIVLIVGLTLVLEKEVVARVQGIVTLIVGILAIIGGIALILVALAELIVMVTLFVAVPFGTIAYLARWGDFDTDAAAALLSVSMTLKLVFSVCLLLAHQSFIKNKGLVLVTLTSFLGNMVISFLHGFVPGVLVSITDAVAAIIVVILAVIWAVIYVVFAIPGVIKALRRRTGQG